MFSLRGATENILAKIMNLYYLTTVTVASISSNLEFLFMVEEEEPAS